MTAVIPERVARLGKRRLVAATGIALVAAGTFGVGVAHAASGGERVAAVGANPVRAWAVRETGAALPAQPQLEPGEGVEVTASGFDPGVLVDLRLGRRSGIGLPATVLSSSVLADERGEVRLLYRVPVDLPRGAYSLTFLGVAGGEGRSGSDAQGAAPAPAAPQSTSDDQAGSAVGGGAVLVVDVPAIAVLPFTVD